MLKFVYVRGTYTTYRADKEIFMLEYSVSDTKWRSEASVCSVFLFDATHLKPEPPVLIIFRIIDTRSWLIV